MNANKQNYFRFSLALIFCLLVRLIPLRAPNIEPIFATIMPTSRAYGALSGFFFGFFSITLYDLLTSTLGMQTFFTAAAYGIIGIWASYYFKKNTSKMSYVRFAIIGTLFFDAFTGLTVGPLFFHQSIMGSIVGQIPFTGMHLLGNIIFAVILSPAIYSYMVRKREKVELVDINKIFNPKTI